MGARDTHGPVLKREGKKGVKIVLSKGILLKDPGPKKGRPGLKKGRPGQKKGPPGLKKGRPDLKKGRTRRADYPRSPGPF